MLRTRVIPILLIKDGALYKGENFKDHKYIGDPINAVKIFNEKEVDEIVFLDIEATKKNQEPNFKLIKEIASEAFMPCSYGGGVNKLEHVEKLHASGIEKIILNSIIVEDKEFVKDAVKVSGSQSIVASIDVRREEDGSYSAYRKNGTEKIQKTLLEYALELEKLGVGEIMLCSIDREGAQKGYDLDCLKMLVSEVGIPLVISGGAGSVEDLVEAKRCGASGVAASTYFVFYGKYKAFLITFPDYEILEDALHD